MPSCRCASCAERACAARWGAGVAQHVLDRDLNVVASRYDDQSIEVLVNVFPRFGTMALLPLRLLPVGLNWGMGGNVLCLGQWMTGQRQTFLAALDARCAALLESQAGVFSGVFSSPCLQRRSSVLTPRPCGRNAAGSRRHSGLRLTRGGVAGTAPRAARKAMERSCPELLRSMRCRLVVLTLQVAGLWKHASSTPRPVHGLCHAPSYPFCCHCGLHHLLGIHPGPCCCPRFAGDLLGTVNVDGPAPELSDILAEVRHAACSTNSRSRAR